MQVIFKVGKMDISGVILVSQKFFKPANLRWLKKNTQFCIINSFVF